MVKVISLIVFFVFYNQLHAQPIKGSSPIQWLSPVEVQAYLKNEEKPIIIDVYTDWCQYCKLMEKATWKQPEVKNYVSSHFYPVKFNAESKDSINWLGQIFIYKQSYKVHMLAAEWLKGNMVYPSTVIIPKEGESIVLPGMLSPKELEPVLKYFGEGYYKTIEWETFKKSYTTTWK
jgi:thioredoxin-related protein